MSVQEEILGQSSVLGRPLDRTEFVFFHSLKGPWNLKSDTSWDFTAQKIPLIHSQVGHASVGSFSSSVSWIVWAGHGGSNSKMFKSCSKMLDISLTPCISLHQLERVWTLDLWAAGNSTADKSLGWLMFFPCVYWVWKSLHSNTDVCWPRWWVAQRQRRLKRPPWHRGYCTRRGTLSRHDLQRGLHWQSVSKVKAFPQQSFASYL